MFEVSTTSFHTSPKSFREVQYGFVDRGLWQLVPYQLQSFLELIDDLRLGLTWLVAFKHSSPNMVVHRVEVRRVWRPFIFTNESTTVGSNPVLSQLCRVCRRAVLMKDEARWQKWQNRSAVLNKFRQQRFNIKFSIHFGRVWNEMQSSLPFPPKQTPAETMTITCLANFALSATSRRSSTFVWKLLVVTLNIRICNSQCFLTMKITSCCWLFRAKLKIWHRIFT